MTSAPYRVHPMNNTIELKDHHYSSHHISEHIQKLFRSRLGFKTGYPQIDSQTDGLKRATATVLMGTMNLETTPIAVSMALHMATALRANVLYWTSDHNTSDVLSHFIAQHTQTDLSVIRQFRERSDQPNLVFPQIDELSSLRITIAQGSKADWDGIRQVVGMPNKKFDVLIIDDLEAVMGEFTMHSKLNFIATDLNIAVLGVSTLPSFISDIREIKYDDNIARLTNRFEKVNHLWIAHQESDQKYSFAVIR